MELEKPEQFFKKENDVERLILPESKNYFKVNDNHRSLIFVKRKTYTLIK